MIVKGLLKKLYKEFEHSAEICIRVKDDKLGIIHVPIQITDVKQEDIDGKKVVVIDLT